jgi:hypothetical protein
VLEEDLEIVGRPRLTLWVETEAPVLNFVARLCEVAPDGASALVTKGVLNGTHRASHTDPTPLPTGEPVELEIELDATGWVFTPGHRLRLSVANADFPNTWPSPELATSRILLGGDYPSRLVLPVVPPVAESLPDPTFERSPFPVDADHPLERPSWRVSRDLASGRVEVTIEGASATRFEDGGERVANSTATASVDEHDPARAWVRGHQVDRYRWPGQTVELQSRGQITSSADAFNVTLHVELSVDGMPHFHRRWVASYPGACSRTPGSRRHATKGAHRGGSRALNGGLSNERRQAGSSWRGSGRVDHRAPETGGSAARRRFLVG